MTKTNTCLLCRFSAQRLKHKTLIRPFHLMTLSKGLFNTFILKRLTGRSSFNMVFWTPALSSHCRQVPTFGFYFMRQNVTFYFCFTINAMILTTLIQPQWALFVEHYEFPLVLSEYSAAWMSDSEMPAKAHGVGVFVELRKRLQSGLLIVG